MTDKTPKTDDTHTYSFTAEEHLAGSIEDNSAKLGERSHEELGLLHDFESTNQKRAGMLSAIDAERKARGEAADTALASAREAAERAGRTLADESEVAELREKLATAEKERDAAVAKASKAGRAKAPPTAKAVKPRTLKADDGGDFDNATTIAFANAQGVTRPEIVDLQFGEDDFAMRREAKVLNEGIEFDGTEPQTEIAAAYLLDSKGKVAAVAELMQPITIGGGRKGTFPAGSLLFRAAPPADAGAA